MSSASSGPSGCLWYDGWPTKFHKKNVISLETCDLQLSNSMYYILVTSVYEPKCHDSTIFIFSFMPTFFFLVYFTLSHVTLLSHGSHVQLHDGSPDLSHYKGTWSVTWPWTIFTSHMSLYDSLLCVSSILSLWLTLPNLWLPWKLPHHWLILPHHTLQYDVTVYMYLPIISTLVVVYKSGILGTQSPRLDFTCNTVLVNWSPTRRNSIPHLFHLRHSSWRLCVLEGVTHHQKL